ncbi:amidase family protein [Actinosynnema sp. CA-299493]
MRLVVRLGRGGGDAGADRVVRQAVDVLRRSGAVVVEVELPYQSQVEAAEFPALVTEFKHDLERYLATRPGVPRTVSELIAFNEADPVELAEFGQELVIEAAQAPPVTDPVYVEQRRTATALARRSIDEVLAAHRLDVIMAPTNGPAWWTEYGDGDAFELGSSTPAAVAGYPNATVLRFAAAFEQAAHARRTPGYLASSTP